MTKYVIAVRRALRGQVGPDWAKPLSTIEGIEIVGDANPYRLRIEATDSAIALARRRLGRYCLIEEVEPRYVMG
ncbi:MAG TPA: hypothetical protein VLF66_09750 [Thermoanaerobaculia bacterium]|nr:hypothetical protein [Thermoanaerobaculia bacterium]